LATHIICQGTYFSIRADELPYPNVTVCFAKYFDKRWLAGNFKTLFKNNFEVKVMIFFQNRIFQMTWQIT